MTLDRLPLLDAIDAAADLLRTADPNYSPADDELIFRRLQKSACLASIASSFRRCMRSGRINMPRRQRRTAIRHRQHLRIGDEYARANVPADPFVCPCGAVLNDPLDPHYAAAKAARQGENNRGMEK
ncbi:MAG TPA: hypothetical protein VKB76_18650 [Ktedonobacterales bacterium]|nr:hypothetical protein [Ktedonobacterales bacterium]